MKAPSLRVLALASLPAFGACADTGAPTVTTGFEVTVAPLELVGIGDACYRIQIAGASSTVVDLPEVCASDYGNSTGGDITYIAPCDASLDADTDAGDGSEPGVQNLVTVWPTLFDDEGVALTDWENPCNTDDDAAIEGCVLEMTCKENADTLVEFNFTIMRDAQQGFFDVAVNFEDIFCSAKLDSCYDVVPGATTYSTQDFTYNEGTVTATQYTSAGGKSVYIYWTGTQWAVFEVPGGFMQLLDGAGPTLPGEITIGQAVYTLVQTTGPSTGTPMNLLFGTNGREHTAVAALACTAGKDSTGTSLIMAGPLVKCANGISFTLDLENALPGNNTATWTLEGTTKTLEYAVYSGEEDLNCGTGVGSCQKVYYNLAFNLQHLVDQGLSNCNLVYAASAVETPAAFSGTTTFNQYGYLSDENGIYPGISFGGKSGAQLLGTALGCYAHPLNGDNSAVQTGYIRGAAMGGANASSFKGLWNFDGSVTDAFLPDQEGL